MADATQRESSWYGEKGLLSWFAKWLRTYSEKILEAYNLINGELIPTRQYERALVWCMYVFDVTVLTHQMVSMVRQTDDSDIYSAFFIETTTLIDILKRLEYRMDQCRVTFDELLTVDAIHRSYVALSDTDDGVPREEKAIELYESEFDSLAGRSGSDTTPDSGALPKGVLAYATDADQANLITDVLNTEKNVDERIVELAQSLEILRASCNKDAVRANNLENRLSPNNVRDIKLISVPGDAALARQVTQSYLASLYEAVDGVRVYRVDYSGLLSRWRGETENNFERIMSWMVDRARDNASDGRFFHVLWMDDIEILMSQRSDSGGEDYLNVIKTTMLQIMDVFNKDRRLSRFALIFSTGAEQKDIDAAFRRRIDNVYVLKRLDESLPFRELLIKHMLRVVKINVEGEALESLRRAVNMSILTRLVYAFYVHMRFVVGTEFYMSSHGSSHYSLIQLKPYFNLNGDVVRVGDTNNQTVQAVEKGEGPRFFYKPGETDGRNLPKEVADRTVYVLRSYPSHVET